MSRVYNSVTHWYHKDWKKHIENDPSGFISEEEYIESMLQRMSRTEFLEAISNAIDELIEERRSDY